MTEQHALDWLRNQLHIEFGVKKELVTPTASFIDDLGLDSIDLMNLMLSVEDEFDVGLLFAENQADLSTVGAALKLIGTSEKADSGPATMEGESADP